MSRALLALTFAAGCYSPSVHEGAACSNSGACPTGQLCYAGTCLSHPPGEDDAAVDVALPPDGSIDGAPLDAFISPLWLTPTQIPGVNTAGTESDPCMSPDQLTIVFERNGDLYIGTRATKAAAFTVQPLASLNTLDEETSPELTGNGTSIYFTSDRLMPGSHDVYRSVLSNGAWQAPTVESSLSDPALDDSDVAISPNGLTAFVSRANTLLKSTRPSTGSGWSTPISTGTAWGPSAAAPAINAAGDVYLHAKNPRDLYVSRKLGNNYPTPTAITELNTVGGREAGPFASADDLYLWFERDGDLFEAHR